MLSENAARHPQPQVVPYLNPGPVALVPAVVLPGVFQPRGCQALNVLGVQSTSYRRPLRSRRDILSNPPAPHQQRP